MARSAPMGGKGGGQSVPYQPAGFGQNQQFSGGFGMGTGGFSQPQFGQPPQFGGGFGGGFGMPQPRPQPYMIEHGGFPRPLPPTRLPGPNDAGFRGGQLGEGAIAGPVRPGGRESLKDVLGAAGFQMPERPTGPEQHIAMTFKDPLTGKMTSGGPHAKSHAMAMSDFYGQNPEALKIAKQFEADQGAGGGQLYQAGGPAFGGLGDFLKGGSPPIAGKDYIPLVPEVGAGGGQYVPRGGAQERFQREAGRITDMRYRGPGRVLPPGRFQPFPQPQPQPDYNRLPQPMPMPGYGNFPPRRMPGYGNFPPRLPPRFQQPRPQPMPMPGYGGFPGGYMPLPRPQPMPRYQPALPSRLGSPTMYQGRGFTPNYGVPRSMIPPQEYQLFDQGGLGGFF